MKGITSFGNLVKMVTQSVFATARIIMLSSCSHLHEFEFLEMESNTLWMSMCNFGMDIKSLETLRSRKWNRESPTVVFVS